MCVCVGGGGGGGGKGENSNTLRLKGSSVRSIWTDTYREKDNHKTESDQ